jgi:hypothetical protein
MTIHAAAAAAPVLSTPKGFAGAANGGTAHKCARRKRALVSKATQALPKNRRQQFCLTEQFPCEGLPVSPSSYKYIRQSLNLFKTCVASIK